MRALIPRNSSLILVGMVLGLALFSRSGALPPMLAGLLLFGVLSLLRPELGLLFVPLAATLFLIPVSVPGIRTSGEFLLPLSEVVLLVVLAASVTNWLWRRVRALGRPTAPALAEATARERTASNSRSNSAILLAYAPHLLFILAGVFGMAIATADRGAALRDFRRTILEPLIFYALLTYYLRPSAARTVATRGDQRYATWIVIAFSLSGAFVALLGLLQVVGLDVVPYLGTKRSFSENVVVIGGIRRVTSVYGHPNNLGLYLGRVWPVAALLAIRPPADGTRSSVDRRQALLFGLCALLCLGGILVSFSRGAWLGAAAALGVLALPFLQWRFSGKIVPILGAVIAAIAIIGGLGLMLRGNLGGDSAATRIALWREALALIRQHPLGIGLDQFYWYHNPQFGQSQIDPAFVGTSEQFAAHPHNLVLDIWLRMGPLGLLAFGWLLVRFFRTGSHSLRRFGSASAAAFGLGALAAMTAALLHGMIDNFYFLPDLAIAFWLLLALVEYAQRAE
jgi:O-antigen ligase